VLLDLLESPLEADRRLLVRGAPRLRTPRV
jgi:hypothetical protein